jgi:hypothetical protein
MAVTVPAGDARVVAVRAALEPRGPSNGLSFPQNECVEALVQVLDACRWRSLTVDRLSRLLVDAAQAWRQERAWYTRSGYH